MTKYYYSYNTEGNAYSGKYPALKNPRRQNEYLLPSMATFKEPPKTEENEVAIWNGSDWIIEPDFRGETQINIETRERSIIDYVGEVKSGFQKVSEELAHDILINPDKYKVIDNHYVDISDTEEYALYIKKKELEIRKNEIEKELLELDSKRIRAICEPSIKDETTGETWLDCVIKIRLYVCSIKYPLQILPLAIASDFCTSKSTCLCKLKFKAITSYV